MASIFDTLMQARNDATGFGAAPAKTPVLPQTPAAAADVAAMTRAARVAQYGEAAVAAMEKAGGTFGGVTAAPVALEAPSLMSQVMPTFARGFGALGTAAKAVAPWIVPAVETARVGASAIDPNQTAGETGLRTAMGAGRLAGLSLGAKVPGPWWARAAAATAGYLAPDAAEATSRWFRGGAPPASVGPGAVPSTFSTPPTDQPDYNATFTPPVAASVAVPASPPMTAADITGTRLGVSGTGAFMNNRTGAVTNLTNASTPTAADERANAMHAAGVSVYGVGNQGFGAVPQAPLAGAVGALMNVKERTGTAKQAAAYAKMAMDFAGKRETAAHATAQANKENMLAQIMTRIADPSTPEPERERLKSAAGAAFGRFETTTASVPQGYMGDFQKNVPVVTTRGVGVGTAKLVNPTPAPVNLIEGQRGTAKDASGRTVNVIVRNGQLVPL